jgi:hypothetical protein
VQATIVSNLVILTDHPDPELIFLSYDSASTPNLKVTHHLSLTERAPRPAEIFNDIVVNEDCTLGVVSLYSGKLKVVMFERGQYHLDFDILWVPFLYLVISTLMDGGLQNSQRANSPLTLFHVLPFL